MDVDPFALPLPELPEIGVEWDLNDGSSDNGLSLADLDYFSDIEDEMDEDLKVAGGTGSITIKRTIQDAEDEETGSTASEFFQQMMNNGQSLDNLEFLSDMEDEQEDDVKPVQDSARLARKRTIHDVEELPLQVDHNDYPDEIVNFTTDQPSIAKLPQPHEAKKVKMNRRDQLKSEIVKYLRDKLSSKLNVPRIRLPWSEMKAGDILNWPPDVELRIVDKLKLEELEKVHKLAKGNQLDFSPEFINSKKNAAKITRTDQLKLELTKYLRQKLEEKFHEPIRKISWNEMKVGDILNWPPDVKFRKISKLRLEELEHLHQLAKVGKLDFSPEFISRLQLERTPSYDHYIYDHYSYDPKFRSEIVKYLQDKLSSKLKVSIIRIPWSEMKMGDIINWPSAVEYQNVQRMSVDAVRELYELVKADKLDFSPQFINRLQLERKSRHHKNGSLKSEVLQYLQDKLSRHSNSPRMRIPWIMMKAGDILNWPSDVPFGNLEDLSAANVRRLHELVKAKKLDFSPEFLTRI